MTIDKEKIIDLYKNLDFDEEYHRYTYNGNNLISVSQLISKYTSDFDADKIIDKMFEKSISGDIYIGKKIDILGMTKEQIKETWRVNQVSKSAYGTFIHNQAEKISLGEDEGLKRPELKQVRDFFKKEGYNIVVPELKVFDVFSDNFGVAGTMDLLLEKDGKLYIGDWKTNVGKDLSDMEGSFFTEKMKSPVNLPDTHFWHYALQFSFYRYILEKKGINIEGQFLIHLIGDKDLNPYGDFLDYKIIKTPYLKDIIEDIIKNATKK